MIWKELIKRCDEARAGYRDDHPHIVCLKRVDELEWLRLFSFVPLSTPPPPRIDVELYTTYILREASERSLEVRLLLELIVGHLGVCGRSQTQENYGDGYPVTKDGRYMYGEWQSFCHTNDPWVLECWLRRQPVVWP